MQLARQAATRLPAGPSPTPRSTGVLARAPESGLGSGGNVGGGGAGGDSDAIYDEVLRRLRQEQEQLGQLINHPF